jgi:hypothetical protein
MRSARRVDIPGTLAALFDAERASRGLAERLLGAPHGPVLEELEKAVAASLPTSADPDAALRLVCLARLLRAVPGPGAIDLLVDILGARDEEAMATAALALEDAAGERASEVRKGVERALVRLPVSHGALRELPFVVLHTLEGDASRALAPFLALADPRAVGSAIDALVENAEPAAICMLEPLRADARSIEIEDESSGEQSTITVGELAGDAIRALGEIDKAMRGAAGG